MYAFIIVTHGRILRSQKLISIASQKCVCVLVIDQQPIFINGCADIIWIMCPQTYVVFYQRIKYMHLFCIF